MWLDNSSQDAVDLFWEYRGESELFPRNLERPVALALPVAVVKLPSLTLGQVEAWLAKRGAQFRFGCQSRAIRGCVIGYGGCGVVFVDGADPDDERRFTLAHEVAHFMIDYWLPRRAAVGKLGDEIGQVFDGLRRPTVAEQVHSLVTNTAIEVYSDLMERDAARGGMSPELWAIEDKADKVALALLAPPETALAQVDLSVPRFEQRHAALRSAMHDRFGLPMYIAASYSWALLASIGLGPSWVEDTIRR